MTITPEQFMTQPEPDEEDVLAEIGRDAETFGDLAYLEWSADPQMPPLESIANALWALVNRGFTPPAAGVPTVGAEPEQCKHEEYADLLREANDDLASENRALTQLVNDVEAIIKPSTSKLANSVRATINAWRAPEVPTVGPGQEELRAMASGPGSAPPLAEEDVEAWRAYARSHGYTGPDVDTMNRSQIRTMLGIAQPVVEGTS